MRNKLFFLLPFLYIGIVWFIFSYPYFLKQKAPFPSSYQVNSFFPWKEYPQFWGPVKSGAMPDIIDEIYPWRHFTIQELKLGQIPLWNPNSFSGTPHLANFQSAVFSPLNILFFILPFIDAWSILILLQPLLAGIGTYLLLREYRINKIGSLLSGITFMFSGFVVVWMEYGSLSLAISFLPLTLLLIEKCFNSKKKYFSFVLPFLLPLSFFSGHFQASLYLLIFSTLYILFKYLEVKNLKKVISVLLLFLFGLILSLPQLLPSIQLYLYSLRSGIFIKEGGIPFFYLVTSFAPDFFGNPVTRNDWYGYYAEWASFVGVTAILLSSFIRIQKKTIFFLTTSIVFLLLAVESPVQKLIGILHVPVISTSTPSRIVVLFSFSIAVLAGFGAENIIQMIKKKTHKRIIITLSIFCLLFVLIWLTLLLGKFMPIDKEQLARKNVLLPTFILLLGCAGMMFSVVKKKFITFVLMTLLFVATFDSLRFAIKWTPFERKDFVFPKLSVLSAMEKEVGTGRAYGNLGAHVDTYYNIPSIEGYDPLYIGRYGEFLASAKDGTFLEGSRSVAQLPKNGVYVSRVLDLLGVTVMFHPVLDTGKPWAFPVWKDEKRFTKVFDDGKFQLYKNNSAFSRFTLFYNYEEIGDSKKIIERFYSKDFNYRKTLLLEEKLPVKLFAGKGKVRILTYSPNYIKVKVDTNKPALLFLSDNYYPGWKAMINGKKTKIYRADYSFRSVLVPKGESIVEFNYGFPF